MDTECKGSYRRGCRCSECKSAWAAYMRDYYARNRERVSTQKAAREAAWTPEQKAARRKWFAEYMRHPDRQEQKREQRRRRRSNPEYREREKAQRLEVMRTKTPSERALIYRRHLLKTKYGMSLDDYDTMLASQGGVCAICNREQVGMNLHVDHCHDSGIVRGLLCTNCNTALGLLGDDVVRLIGAIQYLERKDR